MADLQILATYPVYGIILNIFPYTYPAIVAFLVVAALLDSLKELSKKVAPHHGV